MDYFALLILEEGINMEKLIKIVSDMNEISVFKITQVKNYRIEEWRKDIKRLV